MTLSEKPRQFSFRQLLPKEHGSWSLALEPVALGMIAVWSLPGALLALATVSAFLARRPIQLFRQSRQALIVAAVLLGVAFLGLGWSVALCGLHVLFPLIPATVGGVFFAIYDLRKQGREQIAELSGAAAFACVSAAISVAGGIDLAGSCALGALMLGRAVPSVMMVRAFLRQRKGREDGRLAARYGSLAAVLVTAALVAAGVAPWIALALSVLLLGRALWLLGRGAPDWPARRIGLMEMALGVVYVVWVGLGTKALGS
jgi:hypothetical protein